MDGQEIKGTRAGEAEQSYCLNGEVGGAKRLYQIQAGANRIGSHLRNNIILPTHGVSREHAVIRLEDSRLSISDLDSTNGTFVNGQRVAEANLATGDIVGLGSTEMEVVRRKGDDLTLAFTLQLSEKSHVAEHGDQATELLPSRRGASAADLVEVLIERLTESAAGPAAAALEVIIESEGLESGCIVSWTGSGEPTLRATVGELNGDALRRLGRPLFERATLSTECEEFWYLGTLGDEELTCAVLAEAGSSPLGLVLPGRVPRLLETRELRTILRLVGLLGRTPDPGDEKPRKRGTASTLSFPDDYVVGSSPAIASLYRQMRRLQGGRMPVILLGETGVGKEHLAQILHRSSDRSAGPFVVVNCAAIPADLLEAEMFGIASGVATGVSQRPGSFQLAHGGTLFLDEIDGMLPALQTKLLRAIEETEVRPVGGSPRFLDVRIVTATNSDLPTLIEKGSFRRDLYYRLAGYELRVPALRERREDIPSLVEHFVRKFSAESGKAVEGMSLGAMNDLTRRAWQGNIRELRHEVRRLVFFCPQGEAIRTSDLPEAVEKSASASLVESLAENNGHLDLPKTLTAVESHIIRLALRRTDGNKTAAARLLGVSRNGLRIKLRRLGLEDDSD